MKDGPWWRRGVVYQIYPRSFQDSGGDGVGDLPGIIARLDYLAGLGVDALWLSPIFPSPMEDFGYDVSDFTGIDPVFGTLADFDRLLAEAHRRGLRIILDFVANHSSDRHPWFVESRSSRASAKRDWYVWRDPAPGGGPPNNWLSEFGGPAWAFDRGTGQYYYHCYLKSQPDLNWRNPSVQNAMHEVMRFWFARGVDGFRIDAVHRVLEDARFRDNPGNPEWRPGLPPARALRQRYTADLPELQQVIRGLRRVADDYPERLLIGEAYLPLDRVVRYYGRDGDGLHLPFNFALIGIAWRAAVLARLIRRYERLLPEGAWPNWVLGNHDRARLASRLGPAQARAAAMLLLTLRGTPTLYYGDELGLEDVVIPPERVQDPVGQKLPGYGMGRDPERTPMPWDRGRNAGFTAGEPWLPLNPDAASRNVLGADKDPASLLSLYRRLIRLRRLEPALSIGDYGRIGARGEILFYERVAGRRRLLVALNLGDRPAPFDLAPFPPLRLLLATQPRAEEERTAGPLRLAPGEGVILAAA